MDNIPEQRETLDSFCRHINDQMMWRSTPGRKDEKAKLLISCSLSDAADVGIYNVLATRYNNIGKHALKISIWEQADNAYIGAVGYHHENSEPYFKQVRRDFSEEDIYYILTEVLG